MSNVNVKLQKVGKCDLSEIDVDSDKVVGLSILESNFHTQQSLEFIQ